ncbi:MAG: hypothetical protein IPK20_16200 [Betaproteobacteria bacterium]|nr:hypothetical protein [Betaproteobacteria bacterium]
MENLQFDRPAVMTAGRSLASGVPSGNGADRESSMSRNVRRSGGGARRFQERMGDERECSLDVAGTRDIRPEDRQVPRRGRQCAGTGQRTEIALIAAKVGVMIRAIPSCVRLDALTGDVMAGVMRGGLSIGTVLVRLTSCREAPLLAERHRHGSPSLQRQGNAEHRDEHGGEHMAQKQTHGSSLGLYRRGGQPGASRRLPFCGAPVSDRPFPHLRVGPLAGLKIQKMWPMNAMVAISAISTR